MRKGNRSFIKCKISGSFLLEFEGFYPPSNDPNTLSPIDIRNIIAWHVLVRSWLKFRRGERPDIVAARSCFVLLMSHCYVWWILFRPYDYLVRQAAGCFVLLWFVACVLTDILCLVFLLMSNTKTRLHSSDPP